jgi:hypothetical protein
LPKAGKKEDPSKVAAKGPKAVSKTFGCSVTIDSLCSSLGIRGLLLKYNYLLLTEADKNFIYIP